uniref:Uncharacterized protein n=1 Tax=Cacopsylla melanoneura TaxID=428564 RepID=A0A8D8U262_9HEMI
MNSPSASSNAFPFLVIFSSNSLSLSCCSFILMTSVHYFSFFSPLSFPLPCLLFRSVFTIQGVPEVHVHTARVYSWVKIRWSIFCSKTSKSASSPCWGLSM